MLITPVSTPVIPSMFVTNWQATLSQDQLRWPERTQAHNLPYQLYTPTVSLIIVFIVTHKIMSIIIVNDDNKFSVHRPALV